MIKLANLYLPSRLFIVASLDVFCAGAATTLSIQAASRLSPGFAPFASIMIVLSIATYLLCFYLFGLYEFDALHTLRQTFTRVLRAVGTGLVLLLPIWWGSISGNGINKRLDIYVFLLIGALCTYRLGAEWLSSHVFPKHRILLLGSGPSVRILAQAIKEKKSLPFRLGGIVASGAAKSSDAVSFATCGDITQFAAIAGSFNPDRIAVCSEIHAASLPASELLQFRQSGIHIEDAVSLYEKITGRVPVKIIRTSQITFGKGFASSRSAVLISRMVSAIGASLALVFCLPVFLFLAMLIKLDSRGPVFYKQERVGLKGKTFATIKFRSMRSDAEKLSGPVWASDDDPRVTRVGRVLRTLRLDELPQLWNVLRGDMNLIGPRPERPHFVSVLKQHIPFYDLRHSIPPGITGWAQVCAGYGANVEESEQKLEYDLFYVKNRSLLLDLAIVVKTIKIMISGKGAR